MTNSKQNLVIPDTNNHLGWGVAQVITELGPEKRMLKYNI